MSRGRMDEAEARLDDEIRQILAQIAETNDGEEDEHGQAATSEDGIIVATELSTGPNDAPLLLPMVEAVKRTTGKPLGLVLADTGI